jgi:hypothetical protein
MPEKPDVLMRKPRRLERAPSTPGEHSRGERGAAYVLALVAMTTGLALSLALLRASNGSFLAQSSRNNKDSAQYLAEAGIDYASWQIAENNHAVPYTADVTLGAGSFHVTVVDDSAREVGTFLVQCTGTVGSSTFSSKRVIAGQQEIIMDNPDGSCSLNWSTGSTSPDKYGSDYRWRPTAAVSDMFTWTPNILVEGNYEVYAWWCVGGNRSTVTPIIVYYDGGNQTTAVNQQINGGRWNSLGTYHFKSGTAGKVKISCWAPSGSVVVADAVKLVRR